MSRNIVNKNNLVNEKRSFPAGRGLFFLVEKRVER